MSAASGWKAIALGTVCLALALGGCGRKGALDVPKAESAAAATQVSNSNGDYEAPQGGFVLDPLIQ